MPDDTLQSFILLFDPLRSTGDGGRDLMIGYPIEMSTNVVDLQKYPDLEWKRVLWDTSQTNEVLVVI